MRDTLFSFRASRRALVAALGAPQHANVDSGGLGPMDVWALAFPCGVSMSLGLFLIEPNGGPIDDVAWVEVVSAERDEQHLRFHIPVAFGAAAYWEPSKLVAKAPEWRVVRQDDNGVREEVARYTSWCEAEAVVGAFEARAHKQTYWVEGP